MSTCRVPSLHLKIPPSSLVLLDTNLLGGNDRGNVEDLYPWTVALVGRLILQGHQIGMWSMFGLPTMQEFAAAIAKTLQAEQGLTFDAGMIPMIPMCAGRDATVSAWRVVLKKQLRDVPSPVVVSKKLSAALSGIEAGAKLGMYVRQARPDCAEWEQRQIGKDVDRALKNSNRLARVPDVEKRFAWVPNLAAIG